MRQLAVKHKRQLLPHGAAVTATWILHGATLILHGATLRRIIPLEPHAQGGMDEIIALARRQLDDLERKRAKLLQIIEIAESMVERAPIMSTGAKMRELSLTMQKTVQVVRTILNERGKPVMIRDLLNAVQAQGIEVGGKKPASTLSARLSNANGEFKSHHSVGWWFADRPLPQGGDKDEAALPVEESPLHLVTDLERRLDQSAEHSAGP